MLSKVDADKRCKAYLEHLVDALNFLGRHQTIASRYHQISSSCMEMAGTLEQAKRIKRFSNWQIGIEPNWIISISATGINHLPAIVKLVFGGRIGIGIGPIVDQSIVASILIEPTKAIGPANGYNAPALKAKNKYIVRRFHFDYDTGLLANDRPRSHLQYGGKLRSGVIPVNDIQYLLFSSLDHPRIPLPPYDLILTFDLLLRQFDTDLSEISESSRWLALVRRSESLWFKGYYQAIVDYLDEADRSHCLYTRLCSHVDWMK